MGMDVYMYATDEPPETHVSPRYPWYTDDDYVEGTGIVSKNEEVVYTEEQLKDMIDLPEIDQEIANWHRRHDIHGYFHRLFLEKGGVYAHDEIHFCVPDRVVLTLDDLNVFEQVLKENRLPETLKYQDAPQFMTLEDLTHQWVAASHKRRREIANRMKTNATFLDEDIIDVKKARIKLRQGKHIYICATW